MGGVPEQSGSGHRSSGRYANLRLRLMNCISPSIMLVWMILGRKMLDMQVTCGESSKNVFKFADYFCFAFLIFHSGQVVMLATGAVDHFLEWMVRRRLLHGMLHWLVRSDMSQHVSMAGS